MNNSNNVTVFLQSNRDSVAKLKELQNSFNALGGSVSKAAGSFSAAFQSMTGTMSVLNEKMTQFGNSAALVVDSVVSVAEALMYSAGAQIQVQEILNGTISAFDQLQAKAEQVKANFLGLMGNSSGLFMAFLDGVQATNELVTMYKTLRTVIAAISLEAIKTTVIQQSLNAVQQISIGIIKMLTAVQRVWNLVISSGPIGLFVTAVSGLVITLMQAYNTFEDFRTIVDKACGSFKELGGVIKDWLVKQFENLSAVFEPIWNKLKTMLGIQEEVTDITLSTASAVTDYATAAEKAGNAAGQFSGALQLQNTLLNTNLNTLGGIEQKISDLQNKQKTVPVEQAANLEKEINLLKEKKNLMERTIYQKASGNLGKADTPLLDVPAVTGLNARNPKDNGEGFIIPLKVADEDLQRAADEANAKMQTIVSANQSIFGENSVIAGWMDSATSGITRITSVFKEFGEVMENDTLSSVSKVTGGLAAMGAMVGAMGSMVDGAAGGWLQWGANILAMVAAALPQLLALFGIQCSLAVSNSASSLPPPFNIIAIAATMAAIAAAVASIPKPKAFAAGGLVYGNTLAQVGEYPGAANNPEVIAPLSKLRSLLQPAQAEGGTVEFVIKGNRLVGLLNKESNKSRYF